MSVLRAKKRHAAGTRSRDLPLKKPLAGQRILVGRARHQAGALSSTLRKLGAEILEIPFIEIRRPRSFRPLDTALKNARDYDWLIEAMWERAERLRLSKKHLQHLQIAAIGPATKKAIVERGLKVDVMPEEYVAESVVRSLRNRVKGKSVLLVRAKVARDVIPRELRLAGASVDVVEAYETVMPRASRARLQAALKNPKRKPDAITFTSSSTVRNFVALMGKTSPRFLENVKLASIGPVTSATLKEAGLRVDIETSEFTIPGLVSAIVASRSRV
ncbi:MAG: hypothetical protein DMG68_01620 [Acidobacteria bacterium]|nr:MAG: hypothetical protein DMG68_01620 [Acidobacteriota bacterium]